MNHVLYDPEGLIDAELPLDRGPHMSLATAVLALEGDALQPRDYEQIVLQLTGHARAVAADVRRHADRLPEDNGARALAEVILGDAQQRLATARRGTLACAQDRARLVRPGSTRDTAVLPVQRLEEPRPQLRKTHDPRNSLNSRVLRGSLEPAPLRQHRRGLLPVAGGAGLARLPRGDQRLDGSG